MKESVYDLCDPAYTPRARVITTPHGAPAVQLTNAGTMVTQSVEQAQEMAGAVNRFDARGGCYVLGCREVLVYEHGARKVFTHRRFGKVHSCAGHDPARG